MPVRDTVTLDLWLTLISDRPTTSPRYLERNRLRLARMLEALEGVGARVSEERLEEAFTAARLDMDAAHGNGVDRTFGLWINQVVDYAEPGLFERLSDRHADRIIAAADEPFLEHPPTIHDSAREVLDQLSALGVRIGLISNTGFTSGATYRRWFDDLNWLDYFAVTTFSNEACVAKPTSGIFELTLEELNRTPENAIHVGDQLSSDVMGASRAGMSTIWIRGYDDGHPAVTPDYTVDDLSEVPAAVERWQGEA